MGFNAWPPKDSGFSLDGVDGGVRRKFPKISGGHRMMWVATYIVELYTYSASGLIYLVHASYKHELCLCQTYTFYNFKIYACMMSVVGSNQLPA